MEISSSSARSKAHSLTAARRSTTSTGCSGRSSAAVSIRLIRGLSARDAEGENTRRRRISTCEPPGGPPWFSIGADSLNLDDSPRIVNLADRFVHRICETNQDAAEDLESDQGFGSAS